LNYKLHYGLLITKYGSVDKPIVGYHERHHVIPRSHGGSDDSSNLVYLTARQHYLAHWLLARIHKDRPMTHALHLMSNSKRYNAKAFEEAKIAKSELMKKSNPMFDRNIAKAQGSKLIKEKRVERPKGEDQSKSRSKQLKGNEYNATKSYIVIDPEGDPYEITSMRRFCRDNNLNQTSMSRVCCGKQGSHFGYTAYITAKK
jgi:5-methylcytosine-specific restriction endonuclease McrA